MENNSILSSEEFNSSLSDGSFLLKDLKIIVDIFLYQLHRNDQHGDEIIQGHS